MWWFYWGTVPVTAELVLVGYDLETILDSINKVKTYTQTMFLRNLLYFHKRHMTVPRYWQALIVAWGIWKLTFSHAYGRIQPSDLYAFYFCNKKKKGQVTNKCYLQNSGSRLHRNRFPIHTSRRLATVAAVWSVIVMLTIEAQWLAYWLHIIVSFLLTTFIFAV